MKSRLGVDCSYWKARRAKGAARDGLYGTYEESYDRMASYLYMLEQANPGTITTLVRDDNQQFKYAFVSLGVWRTAIPHLRQVRPCYFNVLPNGTCYLTNSIHLSFQYMYYQ